MEVGGKRQRKVLNTYHVPGTSYTLSQLILPLYSKPIEWVFFIPMLDKELFLWRGYEDLFGRKAAIFNRIVREGLMEKMFFEQRLKVAEEVSCEKSWDKST